MKINYIYYNYASLLALAGGSSVLVRYDPYDIGMAYAYVRGDLGRVRVGVLYRDSADIRKGKYSSLAVSCVSSISDSRAWIYCDRQTSGGVPHVHQGP